MKNFHFVDILNSDNDTSNQELRLFLCKFLYSANMIPEITTCQEIHDKIKIVSVIEGEMHVGYKLVPKLLQNFPFVEYILDTLFHDNGSF